MNSAHGPKQHHDLERLKTFINSVSDYAIYTLDPSGFITTWNSGAEKIKGYASGEIIGQHFSRFFTVEDQAKGMPAQLMQEAILRGRSECEGWRVRKNGGRFLATAVLHSTRDENGELIGFTKVTRDITERAASQNALSESERRFRLLVEGVIDYAIYMLDLSGIVINWNAGAERMKGYKADEIIGQHFSRFYTKEDRTAGLPFRVLDTALREGRYEAEGWRLRKDGSRFWASVVVDPIREENGNLLGFAKITRDVTERRAAQEVILESERQFRLLVKGVTDYALYMLDPNGIVTSWNTGAERIKGYTPDEILGQHFSRFYTERERAAGIPTRSLHIATRDGSFETEGWRVRKDGGLFWASVTIDPIKDETGDLIGFAKITRDITEKREAQLALQKAQAERDHAQRMEALGHLTGGVAHDFNNLLMVVSGYLNTIKKLVEHDPKGMRAAEAIELATKRGASLTRQLLTFSRRQTLNPVATSIGERIDSLREMVASILSPSIKFVTSIPADIWNIQADISEFELTLINIAINARDAMPDGGYITVSAENVRPQKNETAAHIEGEFVALTIADTGEGIASDILPKIFDPFFTTKQTNKGSGLGLSQVHGFAHQSGGTVTIESELGKGTRVTLYLPRAEAEPAQTAQDEPIESEGSGTVLLVEDNPEVTEVTTSLLGQLGYEVEAVQNAQGALDALQRGRHVLVLSDIVMSGDMDGIELARQIRKRHSKLPVILVTGYSLDAASAEREFTILRKPYQLADLNRTIANAILSGQPSSANLVRLSDVRRGEKTEA